MKNDVWQLDAFNFESGEYECVRTGTQREELREEARLLDFKVWRIWNRTLRADRPLLPKPRFVKSSTHWRRWKRSSATLLERDKPISKYKEHKRRLK